MSLLKANQMLKSKERLRVEIDLLRDEINTTRIEGLLCYLTFILMITVNYVIALVFLPIMAIIGYKTTEKNKELNEELKKLIEEIE